MSRQDSTNRQRHRKQRLPTSRSVPHLKLYQPESECHGLGISVDIQGPTQDSMGPKQRQDHSNSRSRSPTPPASPANPTSPRWTLPRSISSRWSFPLPATTSWAVTKAFNPTPPIPEKWPVTTAEEPTFSDSQVKRERYSYVEISSKTEDVYCTTWFSRQFRKLRRRLHGKC